MDRDPKIEAEIQTRIHNRQDRPTRSSDTPGTSDRQDISRMDFLGLHGLGTGNPGIVNVEPRSDDLMI